MAERQQSGRLRRVGVLWKPRPGAKSLGSGSVTVDGLRQKFVILMNERKQAGSTQPDYLLMASEDAEVDTYASRHVAPVPERRTRAAPAVTVSDDIPFLWVMIVFAPMLSCLF